jgi:hypothetical protein
MPVSEDFGFVMTALAGGTVEKTVSGVCRERTGLPRVETHEAEPEDRANLIEALRVSQGIRVKAHRPPHQRWLSMNLGHREV